MSNQAQEIKEKLNISDVISGYVRLQKAGVNLRALCPFHNEKTPSFMVSPSRQSWHCFGCGEGGDVFTFVEKIENIEFRDALKLLAEKAGVKLEYSNPKIRSEKDRLYEICEQAAQFFTQKLSSENLVVNYLHKRGLTDETISEWRLGYSPDSWSSLLIFLSSKGYREPEIEKSGLIIKGEKYHDRFRNRLMFPIFDISGRAVAFSGRIMSDIIPSKTEKADSGKYINSPETILYSKSHVLYGLDKAKNEIRKSNKVILAEGQMDAILPWQDGVKNIVAASGTALTEDQLLILKRLTGNLILAFDMDEAGFRATKRGVDLAQSFSFTISVVSLPEGKDPADFVKEKPGVFSELISSSEPIMDYYFKRVFSVRGGFSYGEKKFDSDKLEGKKFIALNLLSEIKRLPSAIERSHWIRELGLKLGISEVDLKEEMEQLEVPDMGSTYFKFVPSESEAKKTRKEILSERLLALLLKKTESVTEAAKAVAYLPSGDLEFMTALSSNSGNFSKTRSAIPADLRPRLDFLYMLGDWEIQKAEPDFDIGREISFLIKEIKKEHYKEALIRIGLKIKKYEAENTSTDVLTDEFQNISKKLYHLNENEKEKK